MKVRVPPPPDGWLNRKGQNASANKLRRAMWAMMCELTGTVKKPVPNGRGHG